jgi:hypothetical protein
MCKSRPVGLKLSPSRPNGGVAVFTVAKGGLMDEASVGGQKFDYEPFEKKK